MTDKKPFLRGHRPLPDPKDLPVGHTGYHPIARVATSFLFALHETPEFDPQLLEGPFRDPDQYFDVLPPSEILESLDLHPLMLKIDQTDA